MNQLNIKRIDLNLLQIFDAVAQHQSVTLAAENLALSQPAVSHALNRLRDIVRDPLFVRSGRGLSPTPHAEAMVAKVRELLDGAKRALAPTSFDAATTTQDFRISASDYAMMTIIPDLVRKVRAAAPHSRIELENIDDRLPSRFENGALHLAFVGAIPPSDAINSRELFREHFVGLVCRRHPIARMQRPTRVSLADYLAFPHVIASFGLRSQSPIDQRLTEIGCGRRIGMVVPGFAASLEALRNTDLILSLPARLAGDVDRRGLTTFKLPLKVPDYPYFMIWHRRTDVEPSMVWLRALAADPPNAVTDSNAKRRRR